MDKELRRAIIHKSGWVRKCEDGGKIGSYCFLCVILFVTVKYFFRLYFCLMAKTLMYLTVFVWC